jgi:small-conductance mechanosensitive channel
LRRVIIYKGEGQMSELWVILENVYLQALLIFLGSIAFAKLIDMVFTKGLLWLTSKTRTKLDDKIVRALHKPVFYSLILMGLYIAVFRLEVPEGVGFYFTAALKTAALLIWAGAALRITGILTRNLTKKVKAEHLQRRFGPLFENVAKIVIFVASVILLLSIWGIEVTALLASAGIAGLVIGLAAKDMLANFFGGLFVLMDTPYKVGDYIVLETGEKGIVTDVGIRSTRIITRDDIEITIPNAQIANAKIINESGPQEKTRVRTRVGVAYGSDIDKVKEILTQIAKENESVCQQPEPRVRFREFGDSSLNFELLCWIEDPKLRGVVLDQLNTQIYKRFAKEGIVIPFPQRDIYIKQLPGGKTLM